MNWKKKFSVDIVVAIIIGMLPLCLYLYLYIDKEVTSFYFLGKEYFAALNSLHFNMYTLLSKAVPFLLFSMWFISSWQKFTYAVLVPVFYNFHKSTIYFTYLFGDSITAYDNYEESYLKSFLLFIPIVLILIYLRSIYNKNNIGEEKIYLLKENVFLTFLKKRKTYLFHRKVYEATAANNSKEKLHLASLFYSKESLNSYTDANSLPGYHKKGFIILSVIYLMSTPFWYRMYTYVPKDYEFYFFLMVAPNAQLGGFDVFVYYSVMKIVLILCLMIWFVTSIKWYRTMILIPLTIYSYQLFELLFLDSGKMDELEIGRSLPVIFIILLTTIFISKMYRWDIKSYSIRQQIDIEINRLIDLFARK